MLDDADPAALVELSTMKRKFINFGLALFFICLCCTGVSAKPLHHYVFFGMDREKINDKLFLDTPAFEGAQVAYSWNQLEHGKDEYDFSMIREDLAFLTSHHKKLWIQIQDVSFSEKYIFVPRYLLRDPQYHGGVDRQYRYQDGDEEHATPGGWMARRWDPAVQERFRRLLMALGKEFDGRIEGINLAETSCEVGESGRLFPKGFSFEIYRDAIISNLKALKRAFPKSTALQYANFMPGEWANSKGYLGAVYKAAQDAKVGVGGPDLLPYKPGQMNNSYRLIKETAGIVPIGIAVQDGNYEHVNPQTKKRVTISELISFATEYLKVDYIFWCTEEPYFSNEVAPFLKRLNGAELRGSQGMLASKLSLRAPRGRSFMKTKEPRQRTNFSDYLISVCCSDLTSQRPFRLTKVSVTRARKVRPFLSV